MRLFALVALSALMAASAAAQTQPGTTAHLGVNVDQDGQAYVTLQLTQGPVPQKTRGRLRRALRCQQTAWSQPSYLGCIQRLDPRGLRLQGRVDTKALVRELAPLGYDSLSYSVTLPSIQARCGEEPHSDFGHRRVTSCFGTLRLDEAPPELRYSFGPSLEYLYALGTGAGLLLLLPWPLVLWLARRGSSSRWTRHAGWVALPVALGWVLLAATLRAETVARHLLGLTSPTFSTTAFLPYLLPPTLFLLLFGAQLDRRLIRSLHPRTSPGLLHPLLGWSPALVTAVNVLVAVDLYQITGARAALVLLASLLGLALFLFILSSPGFNPRAQRLPNGTLRRQVQDIADGLGLTFREIYLVPHRSIGAARGYAQMRRAVVLTEQVNHLPPREQEALITREVLRLGRRHRVLRWVLSAPAWLSVVCCVPVLTFLYSFHADLAFRGVVAGALWGAAMRWRERDLDRQVVRATGDPDALITMEGRLLASPGGTHLGSSLAERTLAVPLVLQRAWVLARREGIPPPELKAMLSVSSDGPSPRGAESILDAAARQRILARLGWTQVLVATIVPLYVAQLIRWGHPGPAGRWGLLLLGVAAVWFALAVVARWPLPGLSRARRALARRLQDEGVELEGTAFVGLTFGELAIHDGLLAWDFGFLGDSGDRIEIWGDRARFSLSRSQIDDIGLRPGPPGQRWARWVQIRFEGIDGSPETLLLLPVRSLPLHARLVRELHSRLTGWHRAADRHRDRPGRDLPPPLPPSQPGTPLSTGLRRHLPGYLVVITVAALLAGLAAGLPVLADFPSSAAGIAGMAVLGSLARVLPSLRADGPAGGL